ncbi:MAG: 4Fe-4S binding protein [Calditerrivibrio sp.]|nr:4Fe-4S binding protein [Calditerrivibrio sp.]
MIIVRSELCPQNHPCPVIRLCPVQAIKQDSFYEAPYIDKEKCIDCGKCARACRVFQKV